MTLMDIEQGLVDWLKASVLASRLRVIGTMPTLDNERLVLQFASESPAVYVSLMSGTVSSRGMSEQIVGLACVTSISGGPYTSRHGGGGSIGLLELVESVQSIVDGAVIDGQEYDVLRWDMFSSDPLYRKGLCVAVVQAKTAFSLEYPEAVGC